MKIGITGATGFLGRHLVKRFISEKYKIKAFVIEDEPNLPKEVEVVHGDLRTGKNLAAFLNNLDIVIHLAARIEPPDEEMFDGNVKSAHNLVLEALKHKRIRQLIFTSSVAVYGKDKKGKFSESDNCFPNTAYGLSKYQSEKEFLYWSTVTNNPSVIFRPFNIYGPGNYKGLIYTFYKDIKDTNSVTIYGDGKQERDFIYVDDLIDLFAYVVKNKSGGIYNLGNKKKFSVLSVLEIYKKIMGKDIKVSFKPNEQGKVFNINQDLSLVKKKLGWEASTPIEKGLGKTISWYDQNPI